MIGHAVLMRALHAQGFAGAFGQPSVGRSVVPEGIAAGGIGDPTAIAGWCGNRAVAVLDGMATEMFGTATVETA